MSGALPSSLREKFKLLRQWQMQQQDNFLQKQIEHKKLYGQLDERPVVSKEQELNYGADDQNETQSPSEQNSDQPGLMQRMSAGSLQKALSIALDDLNTNEDETDFDANDDTQTNEFSEHDNNSLVEYADEPSDEDEENLDENLWNKSSLLQTVVFQPDLQGGRESLSNNVNNGLIEDRDAWSDDSEDGESAKEIEGIYPIIYSEDNMSEADKTEICNEEIIVSNESASDEEGIDNNIDHQLVWFLTINCS